MFKNPKELLKQDPAFSRVYHEHFVPHILCGSRLLLKLDPSMHKSFESDSDVKKSFAEALEGHVDALEDCILIHTHG